MRLHVCRVALGVILLAEIGFAVGRSFAAPSIVYTLTTPNPENYASFGSALAFADVNLDGHSDAIVGSVGETVAGSIVSGRVYVYSGLDGNLLYTFTGNPASYLAFGADVAAGDVNLDGTPDVIVGAPGWPGGLLYQGRVFVYSGATGAPLFELTTPNPQVGSDFGGGVDAADVNGDGAADIVATADNELVDGVQHGRVYVFSGASQLLLHTLISPNPGFGTAFGQTMAAGDTDTDGRADVAVGAFEESVAGIERQGRVYLFSGATGAILRTIDAPWPQPGQRFGLSADIAEIDGDGYADVIVGTPQFSSGSTSEQGRVYVFSGASGGLIQDIPAPNLVDGALFGWAIAAGDVDGDGAAEIVAGAPGETIDGKEYQGRTYILSGTTGAPLDFLDTANPATFVQFGREIALGDVTGDSNADIAIGSYEEDVGGFTRVGRVYVFPGCLRSGQRRSLIAGIRTRLDTTLDERRYRAKYDVNGDGIIDALDLQRIEAALTCLKGR